MASVAANRRYSTGQSPRLSPRTADVLLDAVLRAQIPPTPQDVARGRAMLANACRGNGPELARALSVFERGLLV